MKRLVVLFLFASLLLGLAGCGLFEYRLAWSVDLSRGGDSGAREWLVQDQYYAHNLSTAYVTVQNALGIPPSEVLEWGIIPDQGYSASDIGELTTWGDALPDHQRYVSASKPGGTGTIYAKYGPNSEDVATARLTVFPLQELPWGSNWDVDGDGTDDVLSVSRTVMRFPFGARLENIDSMPDTLASVSSNVTAPAASVDELNPDSLSGIIVFNTYSGKVIVAKIGSCNGLPHLAWRKLRDTP